MNGRREKTDFLSVRFDLVWKESPVAAFGKDANITDMTSGTFNVQPPTPIA
jgi:hypothetical protein